MCRNSDHPTVVCRRRGRCNSRIFHVSSPPGTQRWTMRPCWIGAALAKMARRRNKLKKWRLQNNTEGKLTYYLKLETWAASWLESLWGLWGTTLSAKFFLSFPSWNSILYFSGCSLKTLHSLNRCVFTLTRSELVAVIFAGPQPVRLKRTKYSSRPGTGGWWQPDL